MDILLLKLFRLASLPRSQTSSSILQTEGFSSSNPQIHEEVFALTNKSSSVLICKAGMIDDTSLFISKHLLVSSVSGPILGSGE